MGISNISFKRLTRGLVHIANLCSVPLVAVGRGTFEKLLAALFLACKQFEQPTLPICQEQGRKDSTLQTHAVPGAGLALCSPTDCIF